MRVRLTLSSATLTKSELATKYIEASLGGGATLNTFRQTGFGESERVFTDGDPYDLNPASDSKIELTLNTNIDMDTLAFQGSNNPTVQTSTYPNTDPQGILRYSANQDSIGARIWEGEIGVHPDTLEEDINYGSREIFVDIIAIV
jgi:hypothetical protein